MSNVLEVERDGDVTTATLSRADRRNAFDAALTDALLALVEGCTGDGTRLLVLRGAGKGFSGGFDLSGIETQSEGDLLRRFVRIEMLLQAVHHAPHTTLALVHGACYGAAADLVASCTVRVASAGARFRLPGLGFGVVLGTRRLAEVIGRESARALLASPGAIDADAAVGLGLLHSVAEPADWPAVIARAAETARALPPAAQHALLARTTAEGRDADLAALVRSAADGTLGERIRAYVDRGRKASGGAG